MNHTYTDPCDQYKYGKLCCDTNKDLDRLKESEIIKELPHGGGRVIKATSGSIPFHIPPYLKYRPYWLWTAEERIWLNMSVNNII